MSFVSWLSKISFFQTSYYDLLPTTLPFFKKMCLNIVFLTLLHICYYLISFFLVLLLLDGDSKYNVRADNS